MKVLPYLLILALAFGLSYVTYLLGHPYIAGGSATIFLVAAIYDLGTWEADK